MKRVALSFIILGVLVWFYLQLRVPFLGRDLWGDEFQHNWLILFPDNPLDLIRGLATNYAPFLDYALKKYFWYPLLGVSELSFRLPALIYSAVGLSLVMAFSYRRFGALGLALLGSWFVLHPTEANYAVEARHYALIGLMSLVLTGILIEGQRLSKRWKWFWCWAAINTHFFMVVMVGALFLAEAMERFPSRDRLKFLFWHFLPLGMIIAITVVTNYRSIYWLFVFNPPASEAAGFAAGVQGTLKAWVQVFGFYGIHLWVWPLVLAILPYWREAKVRRLALAVLVVVPAFLAYSSFKSAYGFGDRYLLPFLGLGGGILWVALEHLPRQMWARGLAWGMVLGTLWFQVDGFKHRSLDFPSQNFSNFYSMYEEVWQSSEPFLLLHSQCWRDHIPRLYFEYLLPQGRAGYLGAVGTFGCDTSHAQAQAKVEEAFAQGAVFVLDSKFDVCEQVPPGMRQVSTWNKCVFFAPGIGDWVQLRSAMEQAKLDHKPGFMK